MLRPIDEYFLLQQEEPVKSTFQFLRSYILQLHPGITEEWKYGMPMYYLNGKMFFYLWMHKKHKQPYIGIVEGNKIDHPELLAEKRSRMKILLVDPEKDIPVEKIERILNQVISFYAK